MGRGSGESSPQPGTRELLMHFDPHLLSFSQPPADNDQCSVLEVAVTPEMGAVPARPGQPRVVQQVVPGDQLGEVFAWIGGRGHHDEVEHPGLKERHGRCRPEEGTRRERPLATGTKGRGALPQLQSSRGPRTPFFPGPTASLHEAPDPGRLR